MIGLTNDKNSQRERSGSCSPPPPGPRLSQAPSHPSPNLSVGPPAPPPAPPIPPAGSAGAGLYPFLLHPGLYQHLITGMNPMLLNAQLQALAASSNPLLGAWGAHPGLLQVQQAAATAERLRALAGGAGSSASIPTTTGSLSSHRYSPYPIPSPPNSSSAGSLSTSGSAFQAVKKLVGEVAAEASGQQQQQKPSSPEMKTTEDSNSHTETEVNNENKTENNSSDIKNMEKLVNGLNGSSASKFGISHNNNDASSPTNQQPQISA